MIVVLPSGAEIAGAVLENAAPISALTAIGLMAVVVVSAVWSRRPERRCASAALLDSVLSVVASVAKALVITAGAVIMLAGSIVAVRSAPAHGV
ncbi:hypothetical protein AD006_32505 (plasmid) [Pseudonocardia sp. EC080610-09]|uniref:hypothetical protein n=1 Tax=Pseudonocardia sp. EC080610-09 TaxID=1688404 RepID=UPI0007066B6A|nr:hypothetical protein [Pseudonocardia sp. EC080610-09]ALL79947.1 hypothetical protein AD006_32505 [Pseudonocardia sp. EC080610-09]